MTDDPPPSSRPSARILVLRTSARDARSGNIRVWIDYQPLGALRYGETLNHVIAPGPHVVRVSNNWFTLLLDVNAEPDHPVTLQCGTAPAWAQGLWPPFRRLIALGLWVTIE
jgi:hypothetical protein